MQQSMTNQRGFFANLRNWFHLPGGRLSIEDRVRDVVTRSSERPMPSACPRCGGGLLALTLLSHSAPKNGMTMQRTFCADCGIEDEWHQLTRTVRR